MIVPDMVFDINLDNWTKDHIWLGQQGAGQWWLYSAIPKEYVMKNGWYTPAKTQACYIGKSSYIGHTLYELKYD